MSIKSDASRGGFVRAKFMPAQELAEYVFTRECYVRLAAFGLMGPDTPDSMRARVDREFGLDKTDDFDVIATDIQTEDVDVLVELQISRAIWAVPTQACLRPALA